SLREWFRGFVLRHKGRPLTQDAPAELDPLNLLQDRDEAFIRIVPQPMAPPRFALQARRPWRSPGALLLPVGEALAPLACAEDFSKPKACEGPACALLFADPTGG